MGQLTNINTNQAAVNSISRFNGFYSNVYRDTFVNGFSFVFITRPLLFITPITPPSSEREKRLAYMNMTRDPKFVPYLNSESLNNIDQMIPRMLSFETELFNSSFLPMFTNEIKSFEPSDITMEQTEAFSTTENYREILPTNKTSSEASGQLTITVSEDTNLTFTKLMSLWVNYIGNVTNGTFDANPEMINNGTLDYTSSIYYFVLEPDGKTLKYWAKYTGCWPTSVPYSALNYSRGEKETVDSLSLQFVYNVKEDMNPNILEDFNRVSLHLTNLVPEDSVNGYYRSFKDSSLLVKSKLQELPGVATLLNSQDRDPIVLFKPASDISGNPDKREDKFELIFDSYGYKSYLLDDILDDDYYSDIALNNDAFTD